MNRNSIVSYLILMGIIFGGTTAVLGFSNQMGITSFMGTGIMHDSPDGMMHDTMDIDHCDEEGTHAEDNDCIYHNDSSHHHGMMYGSSGHDPAECEEEYYHDDVTGHCNVTGGN